MQATLLTTIAALALGTNAGVLRRQGADNPRLAQFRVFSDFGCFNLNEGFFTVDKNQSNMCQSFASTSGETPNGYVSIELQGLQSAASNCQLYLYSDTACTQTETPAPLDSCVNATVTATGATDPTWNAWNLKCGTAASRTENQAYPNQN